MQHLHDRLNERRSCMRIYWPNLHRRFWCKYFKHSRDGLWYRTDTLYVRGYSATAWGPTRCNGTNLFGLFFWQLFLRLALSVIYESLLWSNRVPFVACCVMATVGDPASKKVPKEYRDILDCSVWSAQSSIILWWERNIFAAASRASGLGGIDAFRNLSLFVWGETTNSANLVWSRVEQARCQTKSGNKAWCRVRPKTLNNSHIGVTPR